MGQISLIIFIHLRLPKHLQLSYIRKSVEDGISFIMANTKCDTSQLLGRKVVRKWKVEEIKT